MKHFALRNGQSTRVAIALVLSSSVSSLLGISGVDPNFTSALEASFPCVEHSSHSIKFRVRSLNLSFWHLAYQTL